MTKLEFLRRYVLPLSWFRLGSVSEVLDWPVSRLFRVTLLLEEDSVLKTFKSLRGDVVV